MKVVGDPISGAAAPGAATLASVESAPVAQLVERLLDVSDNEAAEVLAHHVGLAVSGDGSFAGGAAGVLSTLAVARASRPARTSSTTARGSRGTTGSPRPPCCRCSRWRLGPTSPSSAPLITGLPVAGFTGSLADRFAAADVAGARRRTGQDGHPQRRAARWPGSSPAATARDGVRACGRQDGQGAGDRRRGSPRQPRRRPRRLPLWRLPDVGWRA